MLAKRSVTVAAGISAAFLASSTAFAVSNGIFGNRRAERVGTFRPIEARLVPTNSIVAGAPPPSSSSTALPPGELDVDTATTGAAIRPNPVLAPGAVSVAPPTATAPTSHSTASTIPSDSKHEHDDHGTADDGLESDD